MKVIWFTRIRYDRGRHFSGDSGAAVSVISCHVSECASPHILSAICVGLPSRGHKFGQTVFKDSIVIRLSFDTALSALIVFLNASGGTSGSRMEL